MSEKKKKKIIEVSSVVFLLIAAILTLFPFYIMVATATKSQYEFATMFWTFKLPPLWDNFKTAFEAIKHYIGNSFTVTTVNVLIVMTMSTIGAYAFSRMKFPGRMTLYRILLFLMFMPMPMMLIPQFVIKYKLGLYDNYWALWITSFAPIGNIVIMKGYFDDIPRELFESMKIDGAKEWTLITRLLIPMSTGIIGTYTLMTFISGFNDFMGPYLYLSDETKFTIPIGLKTLEGAFGANYGVLMAGYSMIAIPMMIFIVVFQRFYLSGLKLGAVKG